MKRRNLQLQSQRARNLLQLFKNLARLLEIAVNLLSDTVIQNCAHGKEHDEQHQQRQSDKTAQELPSYGEFG